jgi:hypothetical protein
MSETSRREALKLTAAAGAAILGTSLLSEITANAQEVAGGMDFQQIDAGIQKLNLANYVVDGRPKSPEALAAAGGITEQICPVYKAIRPILVVLAALPIIPPAWRAALSAFITLMDGICP